MPASYSNAKATLDDVGELVYDSLTSYFESVITDLAAIRAAYNGDRQDLIEQLIRDARNSMGSVVDGGAAESLYTRALVEMANAAGYSGEDVFEAIEWLKQYMGDVGIFAGGSVDEYIDPRGISRGTVNSPTNTTVKRLTTDEYGQAIEAGNAETMRVEITSTSSDTNKRARIYFAPAGQDIFDLAGSGRAPVDLALVDEYNPGPIVNSQLVHGAADAASVNSLVSGWTLTGTWVSDTGVLLGSLATSIQIAGAGRIEQTMPTLDPGTPYLPYAWVYTTSATNNIDLDWGDTSQNFNSGYSSNQWRLLLPDMDSDLWPRQFDTPGAELALEVNSTSGVVNVAMIGLAPLVKVGDTWFAIFTGASGATVSVPVQGATATIADTLSIAGRHAHIQALLYGTTLPTAGSNNIDNITP